MTMFLPGYEPKPGDIGLVRIKGRVGFWIRVGQWLVGDGFANFEHAFVYVGANQVIEAMPGGAQLNPYWETYQGEKILWLPAPDEATGREVAGYARSLEGVPYSFADYLAIALHRFHIPTPRLRKYIESSKHLICSQLADEAAKRAGWHIFEDGRWSGHVTPGDLVREAIKWWKARLG